MLERFLFRKVEMWFVLLIIILGLVAMLVFGMAVRDLTLGRDRFGPASPAVRNAVSLHTDLAAAVRELRHPTRAMLARHQDFADQAGFDFAAAPGTAPDAPYLMLNRYDGDLRRSVSELVDLDAQETVHRWIYEVDAIWRDSDFQSSQVDLATGPTNLRFRSVHALPTPEGDVVVQSMTSPLLKLDLCGDLVWEQSQQAFHHSIERDGEGNFWAPAHLEPQEVLLDTPAEFIDDAIVQVSPDGEILQARSVIDILDANGLTHLIYGNGFQQLDPIHLNDIEPVLEDGVMWKTGDLFLSIRNRSLILLYRPETGEVLWSQAGPWLHQHDVDVVDDRRISVFDNNARLIGPADPRCKGTSTSDPCVETRTVNHRIVVDVPAGITSRSFEKGFEQNEVRTTKQGQMALLDDDTLFVEETNRGRLLAFDRAGDLAWSYVNTAPGDGQVYTLNWSRIVDRATGDAIRARAAEKSCPAPG